MKSSQVKSDCRWNASSQKSVMVFCSLQHVCKFFLPELTSRQTERKQINMHFSESECSGIEALSCCSQVLMDVYNRLSKVDEFLPLAKRERYMFTFRGINLEQYIQSLGSDSAMRYLLEMFNANCGAEEPKPLTNLPLSLTA